MRGSGLTEKSSQGKPIFGFTDTETVKLDFDNMPLEEVKYWACKTMGKFRLGGFIILRSSKHSFHVVFDKAVSWIENVGIIAWVCLITKYRKLTEWLIMQCIKHASTLRISAKGKKPTPRIVYRYGNQDRQIRDFLLFRRLIGDIVKRMETEREKRMLNVQ